MALGIIDVDALTDLDILFISPLTTGDMVTLGGKCGGAIPHLHVARHNYQDKNYGTVPGVNYRQQRT